MQAEAADWLDVAAVRRLTGAARSTVWRWLREGLTVPGGGRVLLRAERVGARLKTKREWLQEFFQARERWEPVDDLAAALEQAALEVRLSGRPAVIRHL